MKKKLQVGLSDEAWNALEALTKEANTDFKNGHITYSDIVNEMICTSKLDIRVLQAKNINVRKSLRMMASDADLDIDSAIKRLMDLKAKSIKRPQKTNNSQGEENT